MKKALMIAVLALFGSSLHAGLPEPSAHKLPRWRGFNLLERFRIDWAHEDFHEDDFKQISQLGFNFVRLPMDYRFWIKDGKWDQIDETGLKAVDQAVAWGKQYGLHVCLNLHRAPGYCVNPPKEAKDLWTDAEAQRVCEMHWVFLANRYKGIPSSQLSFDLVNEPSGIDAKTYAKVVALLANAIHQVDPQRVIIADGLEGGSQPVPELAGLGVAESGRGYLPFAISHYKADWVEGSDKFPEPQWPSLRLNAYLYGPEKADLTGPLGLEGTFAKPTLLRLKVGKVSKRARLRISADGKAVFEHLFVPDKGRGEWKESVFKPDWGIYQNIYDRDYVAKIPPKTKRVEIQVTEGDWLTFSEIGLRGDGAETVLRPADDAWGVKPENLYMRSDASVDLSRGMAYNKEWLRRMVGQPWKDLEAKGIGAHIGEWGVFDHTPHAATLALMEDYLKMFKEADLGWALWNYRGGFGPLDTGRSDVQFESWQGHRLDRKMMDLLQKY